MRASETISRVPESDPMATLDASPSLPAIHIHLLGGFRVFVGSEPVDRAAWRLRKARNLVKLVVLAPGRRIGQEEVVELLWPDLDPEAAANNFHRTLHAARTALGGKTTLRLDQGMLALRPIETLWIDIEAFEQAATTARRSGDPRAYEQAIALYTGDLLPEDLYEDWAVDRREALRQDYLSLLLSLAGILEQRGDLAGGMNTLRRLLAADPLHEDAHRGLMRLLALSGQPHQALQQYEQLRDMLERDLDVQPETVSRQLYEDIRAGRFPSEEVRPIARAARAQLLEEVSSFVGREDEVAAVANLLEQARLVTLTGPGGVGKTRIALRVAGDVADRYQDGVAFVGLDTITDPEQLPSAIARSLDIREQGGTPLETLLIDRLRHAETLIVLDNVEHLLGAAGFVADLLRSCRRLRVLATSRERLRVAGEQEFPVPPLPVPAWPDDATADDLESWPAVRLFVERARAVHQGFRLTDDNAAAVAELCRRLDALPLAIELAAARVKLLSPHSMLERMTERLNLLTGGPRDLPLRQQTMRTTVAWSYDLLDPDEQRLFRRLSIFAGGCTLEAIEGLYAALGCSTGNLLDRVASLVDRSLLRQQDDERDMQRLIMLETIREFGLEQLEQVEEVASVYHAYARYFTDLVATASAESTGPRQGIWLDRIEREHANLRMALNWLLEHGEQDKALRLTGALWRFWYARGYLTEGRHWLDTALDMSESIKTVARARTLHGAGVLAQAQADYTTAAAYLAESVDLSRDLGDRQGMALSLNHLGLVTRDRGDYDTAIMLTEESLSVFREIGDQWGIALSVNNLGLIAQRQRDYDRSAALLEKSLQTFRTIGDAWGAAMPLNNLGQVALDRGDFDRAARVIGESLSLYREMGDTRNIAITLTKLARVHEARGDHEQAGLLCRESLVLRRDLNDREGIVTTIERLAGVAVADGDAEQGVRLLGAASSLREVLGAPLSPEEGHYRDAILSRAGDGLDDERRQIAWEDGRLLSFEQAIALALEPAGGG